MTKSTLRVGSRRRDWFAGLAVGVAGGFLFWLFPLAATLVLVGFVVVAAWQRAFAIGLSGVLVGAGATCLIVLGQSVLRCAQFDALPGSDCVQPDLTGWFIAGLAMLVVGATLAGVGLRRNG